MQSIIPSEAVDMNENAAYGQVIPRAYYGTMQHFFLWLSIDKVFLF